MKKIVISQPMFFPWIGLFEQIKLADVYVHFDDVQIPQGRSFTNRVQIKTKQGSQWLTVPVVREHKVLIKDVKIDDSQKWRYKHLKALELNYAKTNHFQDMMAIADEVYKINTSFLCEFNQAAIEMVANYFELDTAFIISSNFNSDEKSSDKLIHIVSQLDGQIYITGHGALRYLDHEKFEKNSIDVQYMDYNKQAYPQINGDFDPYVSILDLIANMGQEGSRYINSLTKDWRSFTHASSN